MSTRYDYDLIVIGSGAGGGVAAAKVAAEGKKVALFEKQRIGGECPNFACVPTKALLHAADVYERAKQRSAYGTHLQPPKLNYAEVKAYKDLVVSRTGTNHGRETFTEDGINVFRASVRFINPHQITAAGKRYSAAQFLIATGTHSFIPPIAGLEAAGYITFREAIDLQAPPESLFVIGGGPIGCEFAQLFSSFGSKVHIAETKSQLLRGEDREVGELVEAVFDDKGINVLTNARVIGVTKQDTKKRVHYYQNGTERVATVDEVLIAAGKHPNVDIGLENAGVEYTERGITVNNQLQTTMKHIYAAGDVVGPYQFTHTAAYQSSLAAHNMLHRKKLLAHYHAVPRCVFVNPEVASVGPTEDQLKEKGMKYRIGVTTLDVVGRTNTEDNFVGFVKVLTDRNYRCVGASIVAPRAGEMIHELTLAVSVGLTAKDIAGTIHAFPTYSEAVKVACALVA